MKKKILVVTSSYPLFKGDVNGAFIHELSKNIGNEFDVYLLAPLKKGFPKFEIIDGIKVFRHPQFFWNIDLAYGTGIYEKLKQKPLLYFALPVFFLFQFLWIRKLCKVESIQLIHAHWLIPNALIAVLYKYFNSKTKVIATIHGSDFWGLNNSVGSFLKKYILKRIDALTVVSEALKKAVIEFGYTKAIEVFPMGIDTNKFCPQKADPSIREKYKAKGVLLLYVGILAEAKGVKYLIESVVNIIRTAPNTKLLMIGDGLLKKELQETVRKKQLENNIFFLGILPNNDLPAYYSTADVFILPSLSEGWPVVVMEAMSSGCIPVVTDIPVFNEYVASEKLFFMAKKSNSVSLQKNIDEAISTLQSNEEFKTNIHNYAVKNFDVTIIANKFKNLYSKLLAF